MTERRSIYCYDNLADWYSNKYREMGGTWVTPPEDCNQHLDDLGVPHNKQLTLLDIGCGGGHFLEQAAKRVKCAGVEISTAALEYARQRLEGQQVVLIEAMVEQMAPPPKFDYITSMGSLEHVLDLNMALDAIRSMLKPSGAFYFYLPNEKWVHKDQPNELLANEGWWTRKLLSHGLYAKTIKPWGLDNIAYQGYSICSD